MLCIGFCFYAQLSSHPIPRNIKHDADFGHCYRERGASVADEGKRDARQRQKSDNRGNVDQNLENYKEHNPAGKKFAEIIRRVF